MAEVWGKKGDLLGMLWNKRAEVARVTRGKGKEGAEIRKIQRPSLHAGIRILF